MALEFVKDRDNPVAFYGRTLPARPASATVTFYDSSGTSLLTPTVTLASVGAAGSASVSSVTNQRVFVVDDATGFVAGEHVWLDCADGWGGAVRLDEVASTTITLDAAPPGTIDTSAVVYPLKLTAIITAASVDTVGKHHRLDWVVTDTDGALHEFRQVASAVRMQWADPVTDVDAKRYVAANFTGWAASKTAGWFRDLAERATDRVRQEIRAKADYPHMMGDQDAFRECGYVALRLELAHLSLVPGGVDANDYADVQRRELGRQIGLALANTWVDRDDDGKVQADEVRGYGSIRLVRA